MKKVITNLKYFALSYDKVTTIDNQSWVSIFHYDIQDWCHLHILIFLKHVIEGRNSNNLIKIIMGVLKKDEGVCDADVVAKLMSFGFNSVHVFQGMQNGVTHQIQDKFTPHLEGNHYMAHHTNLIVQIFS